METDDHLNEYNYEFLYFFAVIFLIFSQPFLSLSMLGWGLLLLHESRFDIDEFEEEADFSDDLDEMAINSIYQSGGELSTYQVERFNKIHVNKTDFDFLYWMNVHKASSQQFFYNRLKKKGKILYRNKRYFLK